ncbi:MAG: hypothetical protein ABIP41_06325 [Croceibacterium sp.]
MRKVIMGAAAAAMLAGSSMAQAAPVANARTASPVAKASQLHGGELWLAILAAGLLAFLLFQINSDNSETLPHSP